MKRREFIAATAAVLVSPRRSWAKGSLAGSVILRLPRWLNLQSVARGLRENGWIDGKNVIVDYR